MSGYARATSVLSADTAGFRSVTATCADGRVALGGGFDTFGATNLGDIVVTRNGPNGDSAWTVEATSNGRPFQIRAYAICARVND